VSQVSNPASTLGRVTTNPSSLVAANELVDVTIDYTQSSRCGTCTLSVEVTKEDKHGGAAGPDFEVIDEHHVRLRAELKNQYRVTVTCVDPLGRSVTGSAKVKVKKK
jgi:hypothetical protein